MLFINFLPSSVSNTVIGIFMKGVFFQSGSLSLLKLPAIFKMAFYIVNIFESTDTFH